MKKINVTIKGISPLLMNSPRAMIEQAMNSNMKQATAKYDFKIEAEKLAYRTKKGQLYVPAEAIKGTLIGAASYKKFGKYTAKPIVAGGVFLLEQELVLKNKTYDLDIRTVVIQKNRVVKARPKIEKWELSFQLSYNDELITDDQNIRDLLVEAGQRVGILDFRPQKMGSFGMFEVTKWQVAK